MAYFKPYIDDTGIHLPTYDDRMSDMIDKYKQIFGSDVYLAPDSPDYQLISIFAKALDEMGDLIIDSYNNRDPDYASGQSLDMLLPIAGIVRGGATKSTVNLKITGTASSTLPAGMTATDTNGHDWIIREAVSIPSGGIANDVPAECAEYGPITAAAGSITTIKTTDPNWVSVTNLSAATPGKEAQTDEDARKSFRLAQAGTTYQLEGLRAKLWELPGMKELVIRINDTDSTDASGLPAHSIQVLYAGALESAFIQTYYKYKPVLLQTYGNISRTVTDEYGNNHTIWFTRVSDTYVSLKFTLTKHDGYDTSTEALIKQAAADYVNAREPAEPVILSSLYDIIYKCDPSKKLNGTFLWIWYRDARMALH